MTPTLDLNQALKDLKEKVVGRICTAVEMVEDDQDGVICLDIEFDGRYRVSFPAATLEGIRFLARHPS